MSPFLNPKSPPGAAVQFIAGEKGEPGNPAELLASLSPGEALSVDAGGQPAAVPVIPSRIVRHGESPTGTGLELHLGPDGGLDNITIDGVDA